MLMKSKTIERCLDGGECHMVAESRLPACKGSCSIQHSLNHGDNWKNIVRLANEGWQPSIKIVERARGFTWR